MHSISRSISAYSSGTEALSECAIHFIGFSFSLSLPLTYSSSFLATTSQFAIIECILLFVHHTDMSRCLSVVYFCSQVGYKSIYLQIFVLSFCTGFSCFFFVEFCQPLPKPNSNGKHILYTIQKQLQMTDSACRNSNFSRSHSLSPSLCLLCCGVLFFICCVLCENRSTSNSVSMAWLLMHYKLVDSFVIRCCFFYCLYAGEIVLRTQILTHTHTIHPLHNLDIHS